MELSKSYNEVGLLKLSWGSSRENAGGERGGASGDGAREQARDLSGCLGCASAVPLGRLRGASAGKEGGIETSFGIIAIGGKSFNKIHIHFRKGVMRMSSYPMQMSEGPTLLSRQHTRSSLEKVAEGARLVLVALIASDVVPANKSFILIPGAST